MKNRKILACRLCLCREMNNIIDFGHVPLGNNLQKNVHLANSVKTYPLAVQKCKKCDHYQLTYEVSPHDLYAKNYTYLSSVGNTFKEHLGKYSLWSIKKCNLKKKSLVLDIGSNDGTCLSYFKKNKMRVLGVDPAKLPAKIANENKIDTINDFFNSKTVEYIKSQYGSVDFITSHNVLAHVSNIREVFIGVYELLKKDGYFCFEVGYFLRVIQKNLFDTIYHEHLDYHHARPIVSFLKGLGFSVITISQNNIQGGSIRLLCKKDYKYRILKQPKEFIKREGKLFKKQKYFIKSWPKYIYQNMNKINQYITNLDNKHKIVYGYGAPTKATLFIKLCKLSNRVPFVIEDNGLKQNKYLPKTKIKIVGDKILNKSHPDLIIVFAWNFISDIISNLKRKNIKNIVVISPLPKFRLYKI